VANNMTEARRITAVPAYLKGIAGHWYEQGKANHNAWPQSWKANDNNSFKTRFLNQFRTNTQIMAWRQQLAIWVQGPNETTIQYADDIKTLLKKIDPNEDYPAEY